MSFISLGIRTHHVVYVVRVNVERVIIRVYALVRKLPNEVTADLTTKFPTKPLGKYVKVFKEICSCNVSMLLKPFLSFVPGIFYIVKQC